MSNCTARRFHQLLQERVGCGQSSSKAIRQDVLHFLRVLQQECVPSSLYAPAGSVNGTVLPTAPASASSNNDRHVLPIALFAPPANRFCQLLRHRRLLHGEVLSTALFFEIRNNEKELSLCFRCLSRYPVSCRCRNGENRKWLMLTRFMLMPKRIKKKNECKMEGLYIVLINAHILRSGTCLACST